MSQQTENKVGGKSEIRKKTTWKVDYYKTVLEKIGYLSEKEKQQPGLRSNEQNFKSSHGSSCFSDFLHSNAF